MPYIATLINRSSLHVKIGLLLLSFMVFVVSCGYILTYSISLNPDSRSNRNTSPMVSQTPEMAKLKIHQLNALISEVSKNLAGTNSLPMRQANEQQLQQALLYRKTSMLALMQDAPSETLASSLSEDTVSGLSAEAQTLVEKEVTLQGAITVSIAEDFDTGDEKNMYTLTTSDNTTYDVYFDTQDIDIHTGSVVGVSGKLLGNQMVARSSELSIEETGEERTEMTQGEKKVAVILFDFINNHQRPFTAAQVKSDVFTDSDSVNAFYKENSYNTTSLIGKNSPEGDVYDWVTLDLPDYPCQPWQWSDAAKAKLTNAGHNLDGYDNYIFVFSPVQRDPTNPSSSCWWGGLGAQSGNTSYWNLRYTSSVFIAAHELGHNFGVHHAHSYTCVDANNRKVPISDNCTINYYKDPFVIMGNMSTRQFDGYRKSILWLWDSPRIRTITGDGVYNITLSPTEFSSSDTQVLKIPRDVTAAGTVETYYYLDFRQPLGFDDFSVSDPVVRGVSIRLAPIPTYMTPQSYLIDTHPETETFMDAALLPGETFWDEAKQIEIKTMHVSTSGATISVTIGGRDCHHNPTVSITPDDMWGNAGDSLPYIIEVRNNDEQACRRSTFTVHPTLPNSLWVQIPAGFELDIDPGQSASKAVKIKSPAQGAEGLYTITQTAQNERAMDYIGLGNIKYYIVRTPTKNAHSVTAPDSKRPEIAFLAPFNAHSYTYVHGETFTITVRAKDDSGIGMITIDRWDGDYRRLKSCFGTSSCSVTIDMTTAPYSNLYSFIIKAEATDMSGNGNTSSKSVTIRRGSSPAPR